MEEGAKLGVVAPRRRHRLAVHILQVRREDPTLVVGARRRDHRRRRVPSDGLDGRHVALEHLAHPKVVLRLKVADRHRARAAAHRELELVR